MISPVIKEAKRTKTVGQERIKVKPALRTLHNYVEFSLIPQKTLSYNLVSEFNLVKRRISFNADSGHRQRPLFHQLFAATNF